jgi:ferritin-like metal-binding protein YciE
VSGETMSCGERVYTEHRAGDWEDGVQVCPARVPLNSAARSPCVRKSIEGHIAHEQSKSLCPASERKAMAELSVGDTKLIQYLNEAYGTEKRLETALEAHIAMTTRPPYKKRLKDHLSETKRHGRDVKRRVKQLGGTAETFSTPGPEPVGGAARAAISGAQKAVALAQGPLHALRGTGEEEKQLKNAKTEYASEAEEIATYTAIVTLAEVLGDRETQRLARTILREEERMRTFLEREIPRLVKDVAKAEIPAAQRKKSTRAKASVGRKGTGRGTTAGRAKATASRGKAGGRSIRR